eukprot:jgi/Bigna1/73609/fgenesh1_pg.25_\
MTHTDPDETVAASPESPGSGSSGPAELSTVTSQESGPPGLRNYFDLNDAPKSLAALHLRKGIDDAPPDASTRMTSSWTDDTSAGQVGLHCGSQWHVGKVTSVNQDAENAEFDWADCRSSSAKADESDCDNPAFEHLSTSSAIERGEDEAKIAFHTPRGKSMWDGIPMAMQEEPGGLKDETSEKIRPPMPTRIAELERNKLATLTAASIAAAETILRSNWILSNALTDCPNSEEDNAVDTEIADVIRDKFRAVDSTSLTLCKLSARSTCIEKTSKALHLLHCVSLTDDVKADTKTPMEANSAPPRCPVAVDSKEFMDVEPGLRCMCT